MPLCIALLCQKYGFQIAWRKQDNFLFLGAGKPYEESQDSAMKIFGGKIAEELAKDNQRAEYGGEEMQEISIQYWLEKKENETKEEVIGQKIF